MKKILFIFSVLLFSLVNITRAQTAADSLKQQATLNLQTDSLVAQGNASQILNTNITGIYLHNISSMIFWPRYAKNFIIGVTDSKTQDSLSNYFKNKKIHGLSVKVILISAVNTPFVNVIFIPLNKNKKLPAIIQNYAGHNVVFISANRQDWAIADFVLKPSGNDILIRANKNNIKQKNVIITPLLAGLSMVY